LLGAKEEGEARRPWAAVGEIVVFVSERVEWKE
jgi:hypothetical protein